MLKIPNHPLTSFDVETTGLSWRHGDQFYCIAFCTPTGDSAIVSFPVDPYTRKVTYRSEDLEQIKRWAEDSNRTFIAHNAAFDVGFLKSIGIEIKGNVVCTMNLIRLFKSSERAALKPFCEKYFDIPNDDEENLKEKTREMRRIGRKKGWKLYESKKSNEEESLAPDYWLAGKEYYEPYCRLDSARAMMIYKHLIDKMDSKQWRVEMETWKVLRKIENRGIRVFKEKVLENKIQLKKKRQFYFQKLYQKVGWINPNSSKQLTNLFYKRLNLPQKFLTPKNNPSTDLNALKGMNHPFADMILNIRACEKTVQFMDQYLRHMVQHKDGCWYIHPRFHQAIASTGRESSSDPNLQQVASGESDKGIAIRVEARSIFGARQGHVLRSYDWKNIEAYIPAFKSQDKRLTKILSNGGDIHQNTAESLTRITGTKIERYDAKRVFFGIIYGIQSAKLARTLGVSEELAEYIIYGIQNEYPDMWAWMESLKIFVRRHGFVETAYGRRINVSRYQEYKGVNYYVQGTAGGILKNAKIKIQKEFENGPAYITLPIHDEVLMEINVHADPMDIDKVVIRCMQDNPELKMPVKIPVSVSAIGKHWGEKTKVGVF